MGTVQLTINEWQELIQLRQAAEAKVLELQAIIDGTSTSDTQGTVRQLLKALASAREVIRFAVANYPPEAVRGWPHEELVNFANLLETAPGATQDYKEMAIDLRSFARDAKSIEDKRARHRKDIFSSSDYGEKPEKIDDEKDEVATLVP